jgi:phosphopentomutase
MALREFDDAFSAFTAALHEDDLFFIAADSNGPKT